MPRTTRILAMGDVGKFLSTLAGLNYPALHSKHNIYNFQKLGLAQGKARQGKGKGSHVKTTGSLVLPQYTMRNRTGRSFSTIIFFHVPRTSGGAGKVLSFVIDISRDRRLSNSLPCSPFPRDRSHPECGEPPIPPAPSKFIKSIPGAIPPE